MKGINNNTFYALPHERLREVLRKYNRLVGNEEVKKSEVQELQEEKAIKHACYFRANQTLRQTPTPNDAPLFPDGWRVGEGSIWISDVLLRCAFSALARGE